MTLPMQGPPVSDTPQPQASLYRVRDAFAQRGDPMKGHNHDFKARCPIHDDNEASLHVSYVSGDDGRVLLNCFGCHGDYRDIAAALGLSVADLFDQPLPPKEQRVGRSVNRRTTGKRWGRIGPLPTPIAVPEREDEPEEKLAWEVVATYDYATADGEVIQQVIRKEATTASGRRKKTFTQAYFTNQGKVSKKPANFEPTWYRCPELVDALADEETVWILEGEKDVHTAESLGVVAATNAGGAGSLTDAMLDLLHGGTVRVVVDRDGAGYQRGIQLLEALTERADVQVFLPRTLEDHSDLTDHVEAGGDLTDLIPTSLPELHAWAAASKLHSQLKRVEEADREARAHREQAEERQQTAPKAAETHRKRATRWTIESEVRVDALLEVVTAVERYASVATTEWATEAARLAETTRHLAVQMARELHEFMGREIPPILQVGAERAPAPAPVDAEQAPDDLEPAPQLPAEVKSQLRAIGGDHPSNVTAPRYVLEYGHICKEEWKPAKNSEDGYTRSLKSILSLDARIISRDSNELLNDEDYVDEPPLVEQTDTTPDSIQAKPTKLGGVRRYTIAYTHPRSNEQMIITINADDAISSKWLEQLDFPVDYLATTNGRAEVWRAINQVSTDQDSRTVYQSTGWRKTPQGWLYVHAGGVITQDGHSHAPVDLSGPLTRINLPAPTDNVDELRAAFAHIEQMTEEIPRRVILPLLGHMLRATIGHNPMVPIIVGVPGTLKSSIASWLMGLYGPKWKRNRPGMSLAGTGATLNAARILMAHCKDSVFWLDDAAPDAGVANAQRIIKQVTRMISERIGRDRAERDGIGTVAGPQPIASGLITSELAPEAGSGQQRTFPIPLRKGDIPVDLMREQSRPLARMQRTLLMSSFIQWIAKNDPSELRAQADEDADVYLHKLFDSYLDPRLDERPGAALSHMWVGAKLFFEFLLDVGVLDQQSADAWMTSMDEALFEAWQATVDPDIPTSTGGRVRELLQYVLHSGLGYVSDVHDGDAPTGSLATRLGWKRLGLDRTEARGVPLGWINTNTGNDDHELYIVPAALTHVLAQAKSALGSALELDEATAKRALFDEGILSCDAPQPGKAPKMTKTRQLPCINARQRVLVIPFSKLFPEDDEGGDPRLLGKAAPKSPTPLVRRSQPTLTPQGPAPAQQPAATTPAAAIMRSTVPVAIAQAPAAPSPAPEPAAPAPRALHVVQPEPATSLIGPAAVLDVDAIYTPDGKRHALPEIDHLGQIAELAPTLGIGYINGKKPEPGHLWLTRAFALKIGIPVDQLGDNPSKAREELVKLTTDHELITRAETAGYRIGGTKKSMNAWTRVFRGQDSTPLALLALMPAQAEGYPLINDDPTPQELLDRISLLTKVLGRPLYMHPGQYGIDLMVSLRVQQKGRSALEEFQAIDMVDPARNRFTEIDMNWSRLPSGDERQLKYIHAYDRGGSYLAGVGSLEVGIGRPVHHPKGLPFDPKAYGYWKIVVPPSDNLRMPNPFVPDGQKMPEDPIWVTTQRLTLAHDLGQECEILEAYIWPTARRGVMQKWYERMRDALVTLRAMENEDRLQRPQDEADLIDLTNVQAVLAAVKAIYTQTIGMMGSELHMKDRQGFSPDRRHHIMARANANITRKINKIAETTGRYPIAVNADTICYLSDDPDPISAWPGDPQDLGRAVSKLRPEGSAHLEDHLDHLQGHGWLGKTALTDPADWDPSKE